MRPGHKKKPPEGFTDRLKDSLLKTGLTPYDIEKKYGIGHRTIYAYLNEEASPTVPSLYTLCEALNVSADWLLFGKKRSDTECPK